MPLERDKLLPFACPRYFKAHTCDKLFRWFGSPKNILPSIYFFTFRCRSTIRLKFIRRLHEQTIVGSFQQITSYSKLHDAIHVL